jgi:serine/threonine protein kinase
MKTQDAKQSDLRLKQAARSFFFCLPFALSNMGNSQQKEAEVPKYTYEKFAIEDVQGIQALRLNVNGIADVAKLIEISGEGSFGKVYKAMLKMPILAPNQSVKQVGTEVAIKEHNLHRETDYKDLQIEIQALKKAMSGNCTDVNQIYDILYDSKRSKLYFILEYIKGMEVYEMMKSEGFQEWFRNFSEKNIIDKFINPLTVGLQCLHENGIAHRDIKPNNMMYDTVTRKTKWIDLGLSCISECYGRPGTPLTLAPEVFNNNISSDLTSWVKADYWSFGCSIYQLITFKDYPFQLRAVDKFYNREKIVEEGPPELEAIDTQKYPKIKELLQNLLQVDPNNRKLYRI